LHIANHKLQESLVLDWPAVAIGLEGKRVIPSQTVTELQVVNDSISQLFALDGITFKVSVSLSDSCWIKKCVEVKTTEKLTTVDYLEVDFQHIDDPDLKTCGYRASGQLCSMGQQGEEESSGSIPGCGYPLVGKKYFIGLEHPAAFNLLDDSGNYSLKHYPQWEGNKLEQVDAVFGLSDNPENSFADYLDTIRIPKLNKPMISYCTFWSDPYIGNLEYDVKFDNYMSFFKAFFKLGLCPDVFTLDAGWNDRQSIFDVKEDVKRDLGLLEIRDFIREYGAELSLWLSHNGPTGIAPEYIKKRGFAVGGGNSAAYSGDGYGVMMDKKFEKALTERFCELVEKIQVVHFKIDWDNECATNPDFAEKFPSPNHVRQASLNAMFRINKAMRKIRPDIITRNAWWVSPWWLSHANHLWLCQSGDSEFASLPATNQRDSASTHRDIMYYNILQRDKSMLPLDCFDNHEFADALRNPFVETPAIWSNAVWLTFMRGSTYLAYTLQPESLEDWQVESLKKITEFCRAYADKIFVSRGRMLMGNPGHGEIYGFIQPGKKQSWCLLRNPLPIPQRVKVNFDKMIGHSPRSIKQFYPSYEYLQSGGITFLTHEIKIFIIDDDDAKLEYNVPFMVEDGVNGYKYSFQASLNVDENIKPLVKEIYQIPHMKFSDIEKNMIANGLDITFSLTAPYRIRDFKMHIRVKGNNLSKINVKADVSRYEKCEYSCFALPITTLQKNKSGCGENWNPDSSPVVNQRIFSIDIPNGGIAHYHLQLMSFEPSKMEIEIWASGYEAPSRNYLNCANAPLDFRKCLPFQHPLGFPIAVKLLI